MWKRRPARDQSPVRAHRSGADRQVLPGKEKKRRAEATQPSLDEGQLLGSREYYVWENRVFVRAKYTDQLQIRYDCPFCWETHATRAYHNIAYRCEDRRCPCLPSSYCGFSIFITRGFPNRIVEERGRRGVDPFRSYYTRKTD